MSSDFAIYIRDKLFDSKTSVDHKILHSVNKKGEFVLKFCFWEYDKNHKTLQRAVLKFVNDRLVDRDDTDWKDEVQQKFLECKEDTCAVLEDEIENRIEELLKDKELLQKYGSEKFDITPPEKKKKREKKEKKEKKVEEKKEPEPEKVRYDM
ncbi:proline rotamase, putative [Trichomonas vaginalis G3]|uniref:Proline rotamase, putative n=1 Tax=Trichomonas vaginalis (strain ATCC PRA-98 / G3) TaxID=412133 RepID=A2GHH6_TRIV3|nr:proline rotamase, putative [Trichomonas vaginalis G3]|eukprot:XP_001296322.1 proline rotamase [Trichomonas vaginalis G3]